jgi:hypothetical protein
MKHYYNKFNYKLIIQKLFKNNNINLGRWNSKNKKQYMIWGNYDNCFTNQFKKQNKN